MTGGLFRTASVHDQDAAVVRRQPEDDSAGEGIVGAEYRGREASLAAPGEGDRIVGVAVRHHRRDGAEGLHRVDRARASQVRLL